MTKLQHFEVLTLEQLGIESRCGLVGILLETPTIDPRHWIVRSKKSTGLSGTVVLFRLTVESQMEE